MINFMLNTACGLVSAGVSNGYGGAYAKEWLSISALIVVATVMISSLIYALSNLLPVEKRERLKGIVRYELFEAFISIIIILIIIGISDFACNAGAAMFGTQSYSGLFYSDEQYIGTLAFEKSTALVGSLYTSAIQFGIAEQIAQYLYSTGIAYLASVAPTPPLLSWLTSKIPASVSVTPDVSADLGELYGAYAGLFLGVFGTFALAIYSMLFILFISLPIIQAIALTVVLPVAILVRLFAFTGPKLREVSNTFLALAIGMFFVFPLTIAFDSYVANCMGLLGTSSQSCNLVPASVLSYLSATPITISQSALFNIKPVSLSSQLTITSTVYQSVFTSGGAPGIGLLTLLVTAPQLSFNFSNLIAEYVFVGIVLIGIDFLITVGFISGINKGLNAISNIVSMGPLW